MKLLMIVFALAAVSSAAADCDPDKYRVAQNGMCVRLTEECKKRDLLGACSWENEMLVTGEDRDQMRAALSVFEGLQKVWVLARSKGRSKRFHYRGRGSKVLNARGGHLQRKKRDHRKCVAYVEDGDKNRKVLCKKSYPAVCVYKDPYGAAPSPVSTLSFRQPTYSGEDGPAAKLLLTLSEVVVTTVEVNGEAMENEYDVLCAKNRAVASCDAGHGEGIDVVPYQGDDKVQVTVAFLKRNVNPGSFYVVELKPAMMMPEPMETGDEGQDYGQGSDKDDGMDHGKDMMPPYQIPAAAKLFIDSERVPLPVWLNKPDGNVIGCVNGATLEFFAGEDFAPCTTPEESSTMTDGGY